MKNTDDIDEFTLLKEDEIDSLRKELLSHERLPYFYHHLRFSRAINENGFLGKNDVIWDIGCGGDGHEAMGFGMFGEAQIYGIDPEIKEKRESNHIHLIKDTVEEVIAENTIPQPDLIIAKDATGVHRAIEELLSLESQPIMVLKMCPCNNCEEHYFTDEDKIRSRKYSRTITSNNGLNGDSFLKTKRRTPIEYITDVLHVIGGKSLPYNKFVVPSLMLVHDIRQVITEDYPAYISIIPDTICSDRILQIFPEAKKEKAALLIDPVKNYFY
jgi:hypothetical protein